MDWESEEDDPSDPEETRRVLQLIREHDEQLFRRQQRTSAILTDFDTSVWDGEENLRLDPEIVEDPEEMEERLELYRAQWPSLSYERAQQVEPAMTDCPDPSARRTATSSRSQQHRPTTQRQRPTLLPLWGSVDEILPFPEEFSLPYAEQHDHYPTIEELQ
jgi:hypothetical protein